MSRKKRKTLWVVVLMFVISSFLTAVSYAAEYPRRVINVVYDDSGSMIETGGQKVDTWCQAKYAMEVFAALLGENDELNIYVMSDFEGSQSMGPRLVLNGSQGQSANVSQIHQMVTKAGNTPFNTVKKAYADLSGADADEKWLVVLTDGEFQGIEDIDGFFRQKSSDIQVMYLGMGPNAQGISEDQAAGIYYEKAETSKGILNKITGICTRIFNSDRLEVNTAAKTLTFDVPMEELVVFAQGANAQIQTIEREDGKVYEASSVPVTVQYSEQAATNYEDFLIDRNLKGSLLTFKDDFPEGTYTLNVSGADTIEVYYKPNVEVMAYLKDANGTDVKDVHSLKTGDYTVSFGLVKRGTSQPVKESKLLGDVTYDAVILNNGQGQENTYTSGDQVHIEEGTLTIDVTAHYLEYHSVSTHLDFSIYRDKTIQLTIVDEPVYEITKDGLDVKTPITMKAMIDGKTPTEEEWSQMNVPQIQIKDENGTYGPIRVEKSKTTGVYELYPSLAETELDSNLYGDCPFDATYEERHGEETWSGETDGTIKIADQRTWLERNLKKLIRYGLIGLLILFILGYIPPFKKYLPKKLNRRPSIDAVPNLPGIHPMTGKGQYTKEFLTTIIPYKAEKGMIKFVPPGVSGVPAMKVKAAGGSGMWIMNMKSYAGKDHITFNGSPVPEQAAKPMRISAGSMISVETKEMTYTCIPSNK